MLAVFPFCAKDVSRLHDLLLWCKQLGAQGHPCLLVGDAGVPWPDGVKAIKLAEEVFPIVSCDTTPIPVEGWIPGSVALFKLAAERAKEIGKPWVFVEPDAVPLKADWLDQLEDAYRRCGKPFMGPMISHQTAGLPSPYLEGVAVYPADAIDRMSGTLTDKQSWTFSCAPVVVPNAINTPLVHHLWGQAGQPPVFAEKNVPGTNVFCPRQIPKEAVIYHRVKDGSLINLLRQEKGLLPRRIFGPEPPPPNGVARFVSLRRSGDIIALLPLLRHLHQAKGKRVELVVSKDFASVLEGVSYVHPIEWAGDWESPLQAAKQHHAVNVQVYGKGVPRFMPPTNFVAQAWKMAGMQWNRYLPLEFDRRDYEREKALAEATFKTDKPKILLKLHGFSSPFPHRDLVWTGLRNHFGDSNELVDLDTVKAERIYDLLGLMDRADCLISVDTALLHLNRSHRIPVIALVNGSVWGSSPNVGNVVCRVPYSKVPDELVRIIQMTNRTVVKSSDKGIALVYSDWTPSDLKQRARHEKASSTWGRLGARMVPYSGGRDSTAIGEKHAMPYIHDMIGKAMATGTEEIIALTNNDIAFDERLAEAVTESCNAYGCYWAYRLDKPGGETDNGVDFVAMTRRWWGLHRELFPDLLMGHWWWDDLMARIMIWSGCTERERLYYHEPHAWATSTRPNTPGMAYNEQLALNWLKSNGESHLKPVDLIKML